MKIPKYIDETLRQAILNHNKGKETLRWFGL